MAVTKEGTVWGTLKLVENPSEQTPGFVGPVGKKVPRTIMLRGKVSELAGDSSLREAAKR